MSKRRRIRPRSEKLERQRRHYDQDANSTTPAKETPEPDGPFLTPQQLSGFGRAASDAARRAQGLPPRKRP